jgi:hypothetical protein
MYRRCSSAARSHQRRARSLGRMTLELAVRELVLARCGRVLGTALLERTKPATEEPSRSHRGPRSGTVKLIIDNRNGYATFRGVVMIRRRWHRVSVGVRTGRKASVVEQECWRLLRETIYRVEAGLAVDRDADRLLSAQLAAWLKEQRLRLNPRSYLN